VPVCLLSRPPGAPGLGEVLEGFRLGKEQSGALEGWERYSGMHATDGALQWEQLTGSAAAQMFGELQENLAAFSRAACCRLVWPQPSTPGRQQAAPAPNMRLILLDAEGGPVEVRRQSWQDMIRDKMAGVQS
jgi:hypothetical protein